jgi:hypothetical protein
MDDDSCPERWQAVAISDRRLIHSWPTWRLFTILLLRNLVLAVDILLTNPGTESCTSKHGPLVANLRDGGIIVLHGSDGYSTYGPDLRSRVQSQFEIVSLPNLSVLS